MNNLPASAKEARALGLAHYFTAKRCKSGHLTKRRVVENKSLSCDSEKAKDRKADPKKNSLINAHRIKPRDSNPEKYEEDLALKREMYRLSHKQKDQIKFSYWKKRFRVDQDLYETIPKKQK